MRAIWISIGLVLAAVNARATEGTRPAASAAPSPAPPPTPAMQSDPGSRRSVELLGPDYRSPGLSVALSLTPVPVDFGNLYAENVAWGVAYTTVELTLAAPMMWMVGSHMHHDNADDRTWSAGERSWEIALVSGYVFVKVASGIHAGYAAARFNTAHERARLLFPVPGVAVVPGGAALSAVGTF